MMKWRLQILTVFLLNLPILTFCQTPRDFKAEAARLKSVLDRNHYKPPVLDDSFSETIFESVLSHLDPGHLYFDEKDIQSASTFKTSLDEEWNGGPWAFLPGLTSLYRDVLNRGAKYLTEEIPKNISWETTEVFIPEGKNVGWSKDEGELRKRWQLWIKYKTLKQIRETRSDSASLKGISYVKSQEKVIKQKILTLENRRRKRILENPGGFENYVASVYFRAVAAYYDPHSIYFSPQEFEKFKAAMSTKEYSFGIGLNEDANGNVIIEYLIPGGPAWKSGKVHKGDLLIEMKGSDKAVVDLTGIGLDEFLELLDRGNPSEVEFTFQQSSGMKMAVVLKKEKIETEENTVKGFVLNGTKKIGYISLPGFYTQWGNDEMSSCANDVASEIIKLKGENIEGLILDVRSNGGGSLKEAIEMAGIFIDEGPLAMLGDRAGKVVTLKDLNRGTVYDGPLIILINGQSASASEILAASIQDYHRGMIVGGATYGKATGQLIFPLDTINKSMESHGASSDAFGYATVTMERIYRVTGKSNQGRGVQPDLKLPDLYDLPEFHEGSMPRAFSNDSISKKPFFNALPLLPLVDLQKQSNLRLKNDRAFQSVADMKQQISLSVEQTEPIILNWKNGLNVPSEKVAMQADSSKALYQVTTPEYNKIRVGLDPYLKDFTQLWIRFLKEDPYVEEAFRIATDYIALKSNK